MSIAIIILSVVVLLQAFAKRKTADCRYWIKVVIDGQTVEYGCQTWDEFCEIRSGEQHADRYSR